MSEQINSGPQLDSYPESVNPWDSSEKNRGKEVMTHERSEQRDAMPTSTRFLFILLQIILSLQAVILVVQIIGLCWIRELDASYFEEPLPAVIDRFGIFCILLPIYSQLFAFIVALIVAVLGTLVFQNPKKLKLLALAAGTILLVVPSWFLAVFSAFVIVVSMD